MDQSAKIQALLPLLTGIQEDTDGDDVAMDAQDGGAVGDGALVLVPRADNVDGGRLAIFLAKSPEPVAVANESVAVGGCVLSPFSQAIADVSESLNEFDGPKEESYEGENTICF